MPTGDGPSRVSSLESQWLFDRTTLLRDSPYGRDSSSLAAAALLPPVRDLVHRPYSRSARLGHDRFQLLDTASTPDMSVPDQPASWPDPDARFPTTSLSPFLRAGGSTPP